MAAGYGFCVRVHRQGPWRARRLGRRLLLTLGAALLLAAVVPGAALAATYTVNTTADTTDTGGCTTVTVCSLRDAVIAADANSGSTINVPAGDYTLNTSSPPPGQLDITEPTTIIGAGARQTIVDGNGKSRVFDIEGSTASAMIEDLTITGGQTPAVGVSYVETDPGDGAGIFSLGGLTLSHVAITGNTAAFSGGGVMDGAIHSITAPPPASFDAVTISDNQVNGAGNGQGGGALVATDLTLTNSTIADNTVDSAGSNEGGGLLTVEGTATLLNDTILGNVATEPVPSPAGDVGGGISGDALVSDGPYQSILDATNTIVADNTADGAEQDCALIDTASGTSSHNIQGDNTCGFTDAASKTTMVVNFGPLKDNGGDLDTMVPAATSPAVNAGENTGCPPVDERGITRPQGSACDIGAVELAPPTAATGPATAVTASSATLAGTAGNPALLTGRATIEYGKTKAYGTTAFAGTVPGGAAGLSRHVSVHGLLAGTTYHYQLVVRTTDGVAYGGDHTFTTGAGPTSTKVSCSPSSLVAHGTTLCTATVTDTTGSSTTPPTGVVTFSGAGHTTTCHLKAGSSGQHSSCSTHLHLGGKLGIQTVAASYGGNTAHSPSQGSTTIDARALTHIKILNVRVLAGNHACIARDWAPNSHSPKPPRGSGAAQCKRVRLTLKARISSHVNGFAWVTATGKISGGQVKRSTRGKGQGSRSGRPYPTGVLTATLVLPARSHPARWQLTVRFAGDNRYLPASRSTVRMIEVLAKPSQPPPGFTG